MPADLTFKKVCEFIQKDDSKLIESADALLGFIMLLSPALVSVPGTTLPLTISLLGAKNEIVKLGQFICRKLTTKKDSNSLAKQERMEAVYGLICYTAFFEAIDESLPDISKSLDFKLHEKQGLARSALAKIG